MPTSPASADCGIAAVLPAPPTEAVRYTVENVYLDHKTFSFRSRQRRFRHVQRLIEKVLQKKGHCRIADIGGTEYYWQVGGDFVRNANVEIQLVNLTAAPVHSSKFTSISADACDLGDIDDNAYDLVHSNSVIEHVGTWKQMKAMAANVRRLAPAYYIQTPNFWFPYEPHFRFPFFHFLPEQARYRLLMQLNLGFGGRRASIDDAMQGVQSAVLIDASQMRALFPDAELVRERFGPLTKSLMMIRDSG